ncbi:restriction endonuclease subunit S [Vibrio sp.]|uniref:restriction endonuclease subunit S n=1 Tax=Vibrio sp. TaxID=678 RepID=UPI003D11B87F
MDSLVAMPKYESYKQSGIDWLECIPEHWQLKRLKYVVDIEKRIAGKEGIDVLSITQKGIKIKDVESGEGQLAMDYSKYQLLYKGEFAMNHMDLLTGYVDISKYDGVVSPDYRVFKTQSPEVFDKYLLLIFQIGYTQRIFYRYGQGVSLLGRWRFPADNFNNFYIPIPTIDEQRIIVKFLSKKIAQIDEAIAIKEKQISLLKERKQIIIQQAVTQGLDPHVLMKDSGVDWIGNIPDDWEVIPLKRLCRAYGRIGFRGYSTSDLVGQGEGAVTLSPSNLTEGEMNYSKCSYLSWDKYNESPEIQIKNGDILIVKTGSSFGKTGLVCDLPEPATINPQLLVLKDVSINADYLYFLISSCMYQDEIKKRVIGSTIPTISETRLLSMHALVPNNELQEEIVLYIYKASLELNKAIYSLNLQIDKFKEYKSSLVNSSVTGKIKITPEMAEG